MPFEASVITNNLYYLLWGRLAQGELGGFLLTIVIALAAGVLSLAVGIAMGLLAW